MKQNALLNWLLAHNGRCLWQQDAGHLMVESWVVGRKIIIVTIFKGDLGGWDVYVPASDSNDTATTLKALAAAVGVE